MEGADERTLRTDKPMDSEKTFQGSTGHMANFFLPYQEGTGGGLKRGVAKALLALRKRSRRAR